jgi:hypothetical protein
VSGAVDQNGIALSTGDFSTRLLTGRFDYAFTPFVSLANLVQYGTGSQNIGLQSRFRWILRTGQALIVVFNHAWQENQFDRFEPAQSRLRTKFNYTLRL